MSNIKKNLKTEQRLLGVDWGCKNIGLALSDETLCIASAYQTLKSQGLLKDIQALQQIVLKENIGAFVIGLPHQMDGMEGKQAEQTRAFATALTEKTGLFVYFWDERLSSSAIERTLVQQMDLSRKRRAELIDKLSASYILQGFLDHLKN